MKTRKKLFILGLVLILIPFIGTLLENIDGSPSEQDYLNWMLWLLSGFIGCILLIISFIMSINKWFSKNE